MQGVPGLNNFEKIWSGGAPRGPTLSDKVRDMFKPREPLRRRIAYATYRLRTVLSRLDVFIAKMQERDRVLFEKVVEAHMNKDKSRALMYAGEVAEIRKLAKQVMATRIALEHVTVRLETIREFGEVFVAIGPVMGVVKELKNVLRGIMPELSLDMAEIEEVLHGVVMEAGEFTGMTPEYYVADEEAKKILREAATVAEQRMKESFPELPGYAAEGEAAQASS